jgi:hypothetical protein
LEGPRKANAKNLCSQSDGQSKDHRQEKREFHFDGEKHTFFSSLIQFRANCQAKSRIPRQIKPVPSVGLL